MLKQVFLSLDGDVKLVNEEIPVLRKYKFRNFLNSFVTKNEVPLLKL
jgi:hypothetical protein